MRPFASLLVLFPLWPGGWWIVPEPGIELERAPEVSPALAGWRHENLPALPPEGEPFRSVPDWVCEVLSSSNARYDQQTKAPFYASVGVPWLWMVDTRSRFIEVRRLAQGKWVVEAVFSEGRTHAFRHSTPSRCRCTGFGFEGRPATRGSLADLSGAGDFAHAA